MFHRRTWIYDIKKNKFSGWILTCQQWYVASGYSRTSSRSSSTFISHSTNPLWIGYRMNCRPCASVLYIACISRWIYCSRVIKMPSALEQYESIVFFLLTKKPGTVPVTIALALLLANGGLYSDTLAIEICLIIRASYATLHRNLIHLLFI